MATPNSDSTSAEPLWLVARRLPCLATFTPPAAITIAAAVEMLNVPLCDPPVPQVSMTPSKPWSIVTMCDRIDRAAPTNSSTLTPLSAMAVSQSTITSRGTSPSSIASRHRRAVDSSRSWPSRARAVDSVRTASVTAVLRVRVGGPPNPAAVPRRGAAG